MRALLCVPVRRRLLRAPRSGSGACGLRGCRAGICSGDAFEGLLHFERADLVPDDITVDNLDDSYYVLIHAIRLQPSDCAGIVFGYVLQVSPAPATATFNDVPTGHRFFQFVEASGRVGYHRRLRRRQLLSGSRL